MKYLIDNGADVNAVDRHGDTVLIEAIMKGIRVKKIYEIR